jgi:hypothetical protein
MFTNLVRSEMKTLSREFPLFDCICIEKEKRGFMSDIKIADSCLLALADQYEHQNVNWIVIAPDSVEEYEDFRRRYAALCADGLLNVRPGPDKRTLLCQFTDKGYRAYLPRIEALRALSSSA